MRKVGVGDLAAHGTQELVPTTSTGAVSPSWFRPIAVRTKTPKGEYLSVLDCIKSDGGVRLPAFRLLRFSGLALVLAAVLFVAAEFLAFALIVGQGDAYDFGQIATTGTFFLQAFLTLFAGALLVGGLVGFYARQSEAAGRLGFVGFSLAFFGTILTVGNFYTSTLVTPMVAMEVPAFLENPLSGFLQLWLPFSFTPLAFSWLLLAVATLRARVYSPTTSWFLLVGAAIALVPFPLTNLPFDTALAYLGFVLLTTHDAPRPRSSSHPTKFGGEGA